jgi:DNA polymerase-4
MSTAPRLESLKHSWGDDESGCTTLHIDMDAFYASCEIARNPQLKGKPVIIGTGERAVVSAASYEARRYGINSAMPAARAHQLCPDGIFLPVDMKYYRAQSAKIFELFHSFTDRIEQVSVDECYMDVSGALLRWGKPSAIARTIREQVHTQFNVTCSVGIASNKLIAKLASTNAKPDGMLLIPKARNAEFVQMLPVRSIPGIGPALGERLAHYGITDVSQLAQLSESDIAATIGSHTQAHHLWLAAHGESESPIVTHSPEKSIGAERTFLHDSESAQEVLALLHHCCDEVATRLRKHHLLARTVSVKLRYTNLSYGSKARTLDVPFDTLSTLYPVARDLFASMLHITPYRSASGSIELPEHLPVKIRLAGVSVSGFIDKEETLIQPVLDFSALDFSTSSANASDVLGEKRTSASQAEKTIDSLREKFGKDAVHLGM